MPTKKADASPGSARLYDLNVLHLYARSTPESGRLSARRFHKDNGFSDGHLKRSVDRLESAFGGYLLVRQIERGNKADINRVEDVPEASSDRNGKVVNRDKLTLAGQIVAEIASLIAGYTVLAKLAIGSPGRRPTEHANRVIIALLRAERRRLHDIVMRARRPDADLERLGDHLPDEAFQPDGRDRIDMAKEPILEALDPDNADEAMDQGVSTEDGMLQRSGFRISLHGAPRRNEILRRSVSSGFPTTGIESPSLAVDPPILADE